MLRVESPTSRRTRALHVGETSNRRRRAIEKFAELVAAPCLRREALRPTKQAGEVGLVG
jgi:hypothetical protein